ncbi:MAG: hypothetical protein Q4G33_11035 [bacterium]|nr:hypothetical protein [bacterium]
MYNEEDEEINRLIDEAADEYQPLDEILKQHGLTFKEALSAAQELQSRFFDTLNACGITCGKMEQVCLDVVSLLKKRRNDDVLFLYTSLLSERGLFFGDITDEEQKIRVWLAHRECVDYINERIRAERILRGRFDVFIKHKPDNSATEYDKGEQKFLYKITVSHGFIAKDMNIYYENLGELIRKVNSDEMYSRIKPYIYSAVITRKRKYIMKRERYSPNIQSVFKRKEYEISENNGKNFNTYRAYIELYCHIRDCYADESDIALSDYCFAKFSNLSEWFYENCEAAGEVPMTLRQVIAWLAEIVDVWYTSGNDTDGTAITEILTDAADFVL